MCKDYFVVDATALAQILNALNGPGHYIRELQATRNLPGSNPNPIDVVEKQVRMQLHMPTDGQVREMRAGANTPEYLKITTAFRTVSHSTDAAGKALKELEPIYCKSGGWKLPENEK